MKQVKATSLYQSASSEALPWEDLPRLQQQVLTRILARVLDNVENPFSIASSDIVAWFGVSDKTAREWLKAWEGDGFIAPVVVGSGKRVRNYTLVEQWIEAFFQNNGSRFAQ